jgi:type IV pilus assembly protein PilM
VSAVLQNLARFKPEPSRKGVGPIGLHLAEKALHAVQLCGDPGGELGLRASRSTPLGSTPAELRATPGALERLVKQTVKRAGFKGRRAVTAMPADQLRITPLTYQLGAAQTEGAMILKLMASRLEGKLDEYVIDFVPVRSSGEDRLALVASSRRDDVLAYLETLRKAGLHVEAMEIGPVALRRLVVAMSERDRVGNVLVINFGTDTTYLTIISQHRLLLDQEVKFGERQLIERIASHLDLSPELARELALSTGFEPEMKEQLAADGESLESEGPNPVVEIVKPQFARLVDEIHRAYFYAASETRGAPVNKVYYFGSLARWPGTEQLLSAMIKMPASTMPDPTVIFQQPGDATSEREGLRGPELAIATGLALKGLVEDE